MNHSNFAPLFLGRSISTRESPASSGLCSAPTENSPESRPRAWQPLSGPNYKACQTVLSFGERSAPPIAIVLRLHPVGRAGRAARNKGQQSTPSAESSILLLFPLPLPLTLSAPFASLQPSPPPPALPISSRHPTRRALLSFLLLLFILPHNLSTD
jgi:hypothetical protein